MDTRCPESGVVLGLGILWWALMYVVLLGMSLWLLILTTFA